MSERRRPVHHVLLKTATRLRSRGPSEVAALARDRVLEAFRSGGRLVILQRATGGAPDRRDDVVARRAEPADAAAYARDIGTDSPATFRARMTGHTWCYVVEGGADRLLHATWCTISAAWTREIGACLVPPPGSAYVYESFTRSDARGRGVYPFALGSIAADLAGAGITQLWVAVEAENAASLRAVAKAGFEPVGEISFRRRWGRLQLGPARADVGLRIQRRCP